MAFPTMPILDDFNRADVGPPPSASWTTGLAGGTNGLRVLSNQLSPKATLSGESYWNTSFGPDVEMYATVVVINNTVLCLRISNPGASVKCYEFQVLASSCSIYANNAGVETQLDTSSVGFSAGDVAGFEARGSLLTGYKNGVRVVSGMDTSFTTAGFIGFRVNNANDRWDDFGGGTIREVPLANTAAPMRVVS